VKQRSYMYSYGGMAKCWLARGQRYSLGFISQQGTEYYEPFTAPQTFHTTTHSFVFAR